MAEMWRSPFTDAANREDPAEETAQRPVKARQVDGWINVIFDGPPGPEAGRFVEVETDDGYGVSVGEWQNRHDGTWGLRISARELMAAGTPQYAPDQSPVQRDPRWVDQKVDQHLAATHVNAEGSES